MRLRTTCSIAALAAFWSAAADAQDGLAFNRIATFPVVANLPSDRDPGTQTVSEIIAATEDGMTLIYTDALQSAVGLVDISDPAAPAPAGFIPLDGSPTSVSVLGGNAFVGVVTSTDKANPAGHVAVIDLAAKSVTSTCDLGGQPDSLALSPDNGTLAVVIENERDEELNDGIIPQMPSGSLVLLGVSGGTIDCRSLRTVELAGIADIVPEDAEPEYVDVNDAGLAVVSLQENNHFAIVDVATGEIVRHFPAGAVDLENIDTVDDGVIRPDDTQEGRLREPDAVQWIDDNRFASANEGDYQGGSRGFSIFDAEGNLLYESGAALDHLAMRLGHYPEGRSDAKGVEPEGLEVATYGDERLIFVGMERASLVAVYRDTGGEPEYLQSLPSGIGPEGLLAIPSRNLFVTANETDLVEDGGARSHVMIFERQEGAPAYPTIQVAEGQSIGWGALSGIAADPQAAGRLYAITDSAYSEAQILTIDATSTPAEIVGALTVTENGAAMPALDLEGIAVRPEGGFWLASEGSPDDGLLNRLIRVSAEGAVEEVIPLPDSLVAQATSSGLEGVTVTGSGDAETIWLAQQRPWGDDPEGTVKLISYRPASQEWGVLRYPLETPEKGWIGLSEITAVGDDRLILIERDNQLGGNAVVKRLYEVSIAGLTPAAPGEEAPTVEKTLLRDLLPDLQSANGYVLDKVESFAIDAAGTAYMITDNDGVDDSSGETLFTALDGLTLSN